jgi:hypothetical protein
MAKPVWQQKLQNRLDRNPLYWEKPTAEELIANPFAPQKVVCDSCGGKGKKVTLRYVVNYSFHTCCKCGYVVR